MTEVHGTCSPEYASVKDAFARALSEREVGASVSIYSDGECAVNLWGGFTDRRQTLPWQQDTLCCTFSMTKGMTAVCMLELVDEGRLDLDAKVSSYWPEFAANGKEAITVRQVLSHQAGLPGFHDKMPPDLYYDWQRTIDALAAERPWWQPGERHGYHARTYGFLAGEIFRRITGEHLAQWMRKRWLGIEFYIGLTDSEIQRCAQMLLARVRPGEQKNRPPAMEAMLIDMRDATTATWAAFQNPSLGPGYMNKPAFRQSNMPAISGHGTAKAIASVYGRIDSHISPELLKEATVSHSRGPDAVLRSISHFGLGFMLHDKQAPIGHTETSFGHAGAGGSLAFGDWERRLGFAFVMNQMEEGVVTGGRSVGEIVRSLSDIS